MFVTIFVSLTRFHPSITRDPSVAGNNFASTVDRNLVQSHFEILQRVPCNVKSCIRRSAGSLRIYRARNKRTGDAVVRYHVLERVNGSQKWIHITEWNLRSNREAGCSVIFQTIKHRYRAPCCFFLLSLFRLVITDIQYVRLFSRSIDLGPRF